MYDDISAVIDLGRKEMLYCGSTKDAMQFSEKLCIKNPNDKYILFKPYTAISLNQEVILSPLETIKEEKKTKIKPLKNNNLGVNLHEWEEGPKLDL